MMRTRNHGRKRDGQDARLTFSVKDKKKFYVHLASELKKNPFLSDDDIYGILVKQIYDDLDNDMREYCDADDPTQRKPVIELAKKELGWEPTIALDEGLKKTIEYFKTVV